jgi:hypothetical protein
MRTILVALLLTVSAYGQVPAATRGISPRTADKTFWSVVAIDFSASLTDAGITHVRNYHRGGPCREVDPLYGSYPSGKRLYLQMGAQTAALSLVGYFWKRKHPKGPWMLPNVMDTFLHGIGPFTGPSECH